MEEAIYTIIGITIISLGGFAGVIIGNYLARKHGLEINYDSKLREARIPKYLELTALTEPFAYYPEEEPTIEAVETLYTNFRNWYYTKGGLLMTPASFLLYRRITESIQIVKKEHPLNDEQKEIIINKIRNYCSELRSSLAWEIGTRGDPRVTDQYYADIFEPINAKERNFEQLQLEKNPKSHDNKFKQEIDILQNAKISDVKKGIHGTDDPDREYLKTLRDDLGLK